MDKQILVIKRDILFQNKYFNGFLPHNKYNFEKIILQNYEYLRRGDAESNPSYKQPIGYTIIVNPHQNKIFAYKRCPKGSTEKRLHNKWTCGIGGHIDKEDEEYQNPILQSMQRELKEEINLENFNKFEILGYINYDNNDVGKVHFGILYLIETDLEKITCNGAEIVEGRFYKLEEFDQIYQKDKENFEEWTQIAYQALKNL